MSKLSGSRWQRVRQQVLDRDNHQCQLRYDGCTGRAEQVDHIIPRAAGGSLYDDRNCRAVCKSCHKQRPAIQTHYGNTSRNW